MGTNVLLMFGYATLALPYMYRAVDTGLRTIDVATLTEAAQSLGAGWITILARVILPNVLVAVLSGAFLTFAIVIGEFTMAALLNRPAFGPYMQLARRQPRLRAGGARRDRLRHHLGLHGADPARHPPRAQAAGQPHEPESTMADALSRHRASAKSPSAPTTSSRTSTSRSSRASSSRFLGPSGCGKTTVLRMVAGFE